jgi:XapX domain-containing protein
VKPYLISLVAGLLVGVVYGLLGVRSPAPPVIALIGLLGILAGEQIVPIVKRLVAGEPVSIGWVQKECVPHILGELPAGESLKATADPQTDARRSG